MFASLQSLVFTWDHAMDGGGRVPPVQGKYPLLPALGQRKEHKLVIFFRRLSPAQA